jgi:hypothetical protein
MPGDIRRGAARTAVDLEARLLGAVAHAVQVADLSETGCLLRSGNRIDPGAILDLEIPLGEHTLKVKARVADAWIDGVSLASQGSGYLAGLRFLALPPAEEAVLLRFLGSERRRRRGARPPTS